METRIVVKDSSTKETPVNDTLEKALDSYEKRVGEIKYVIPLCSVHTLKLREEVGKLLVLYKGRSIISLTEGDTIRCMVCEYTRT